MKASVFVGVSLDGFLAREDGALDFLPPDGGEPHGYQEFIESVDAVVIGRKTYETVLGFGGWAYGKKPVVVLSGTLKKLNAPVEANCTLMSGEPQVIVDRLTESGFEHLYVDGGKTIQRFLAAGLIQHIVVTHVPVLVGKGIPLFGPLPGDVKLVLQHTRSSPSGLVTSEYTLA